MTPIVRTAALALALSASACFADDDKAPPYTPPTPPAPGALVPATPSPSPGPAIDEERLARLVDAAVTRALSRQQAYGAGQAPQQAAYGSGQQQQALSTPQQQPAMSSPQQQQAVYQPQPVVQTQYALQATTTQQAQVLVPSGRLKQHLASLGQHLVNCAQPKVKTMTLAPVTYTTSPTVTPVQTTTQIVTVPAPGAQPTVYTPPVPQAPAVAYPAPQQQQALLAPPKAPRK